MASNPFTFSIGTVTSNSIKASTTGGPLTDPWVFELYAGSSVSGSPIQTQSTGPEDQTHTFTGLSPSTTYTVRAYSVENAGYDGNGTATTLGYNLVVKSYSGNTAVLTLSSASAISTSFMIRAKVYSDSAGTQYVTGSGWQTPSSGATEMDLTLSTISQGTYYVTVESDEPKTLILLATITLSDNTPKTATVSQWGDLVARVKSKADATSIPTVGNGTITFTNNGTTVGSFTANATANTTVALSAPVITMQASDPGEGVALAANNFIAVYEAS